MLFIMVRFILNYFMKRYLLALGLLGALAANAQSTTDTVQVKEVITSATKFATPKERVAQQIQVIDQKELQANNAMNTADTLNPLALKDSDSLPYCLDYHYALHNIPAYRSLDIKNDNQHPYAHHHSFHKIH